MIVNQTWGRPLLPPQGHASSWLTEPLLRLRVAAFLGPATVDTVDVIGPATRTTLSTAMDRTAWTAALRALGEQLTPISAISESELNAPAPAPLTSWSVATADFLSAHHVTFIFGGDATSGLSALLSVGLPTFTHAGQLNIVLDLGLSVAEPIAVPTLGRLSRDMFITVHEVSQVLTTLISGEADLQQAGLTISAPSSFDGKWRPNVIEDRIDFAPLGPPTRPLRGDLGVSFDLDGFIPDYASTITVGALERIALDAGFVDPTDGLEQLARQLGIAP